ncbi:hypothetical protein IV203_019915 [Nitzschia inconspicua]|uniref:Uncharacterized protein n=1 Tax=Nitzschia inconspicua TaxID=303405 RepID=A0A9K3LZL4_9STRA|nr:hypothetical protein IV203_019915 [Nitzschia inconspicua]
MRFITCILHAFIAVHLTEAAQIRGASSLLSSFSNRIPIEIEDRKSGSLYKRRTIEFEKDSSFISDFSRIVDDSEVVEENDEDDEPEGDSGEKESAKTRYPKGLASVSPNESNSDQDTHESDGDEETYDKENDQELGENDSEQNYYQEEIEDEDNIIPDEYKPNTTLQGKKTDKKSKPFGKGSATSNKKGGKKDKKPKLEDPKDAQKMSKYEILPKGIKLR